MKLYFQPTFFDDERNTCFYVMCDIHRTIRRKLTEWKKKHSSIWRKTTSKKTFSTSSFRFLGFSQVERSPPSSNPTFLVYDIESIEHQTEKMMLKAFERTFTPMDLTNDPQGTKIFWIELLWRGLLPLHADDADGFHLPKRLRQTLNSGKFRVTVDTDFEGTISGCASTTGENHRQITWINSEIRRLMIELHRLGYAHSVEVWQNDKLVGGLYGVSLGAYFTIESQFSFVKDASKVALVHLVVRLRLGGYQMLDIDEVTSHLSQFGAYELPRDEFLHRAKQRMSQSATWLGNDLSLDLIRNEIKQLR